MFEAKLLEGAILKKIVESIKDIVTEANIDISPSGKIHTLLTKISLLLIHYSIIRYLIASYGQFSCCPRISELNPRWI